MSLTIHPISTPIFHRDNSLADFIVANTPRALVQESMIILVTSKVVSLAEGRLVPSGQIAKGDLIRQEADRLLGPIGYGSLLTIKEGLLIASAGIDESNSENGDYILYPRNPVQSAHALWSTLRQVWKIEKLGVVLTDSRTTPLRLGVTGVALAHWGFSGLQDKIGAKDLFNKPLQMTKVNVVDALAAISVLAMGEAAESRPLAIIHGAKETVGVDFLDFIDDSKAHELRVTLEDDLYAPLLKAFIKASSEKS